MKLSRNLNTGLWAFFAGLFGAGFVLIVASTLVRILWP